MDEFEHKARKLVDELITDKVAETYYKSVRKRQLKSKSPNKIAKQKAKLVEKARYNLQSEMAMYLRHVEGATEEDIIAQWREVVMKSVLKS